VVMSKFFILFLKLVGVPLVSDGRHITSDGSIS
jgi:hypothetical protein